MSDLCLRAHTEVISGGASDADRYRGRSPKKREDKFPRYALVFDPESRVDTNQELTFGFCRVLELKPDADNYSYQLIEEAAFHADNLPERERTILETYVQNADLDLVNYPPRLPLYSRSEFVEKVFYKWARKGAMIVGFNLPFDLSRIAIQLEGKWREANRGEWSLTLAANADSSENKWYPRIIITPIDSKKAFIRFWYESLPNLKNGKKPKPTKINEACFLDLRTLLWSLYNKSYSLERACDNKKGPFKGQGLPQKSEHKPTGKVTADEIEYARQDVRCTAALLNAAKKEFDLHRDLSLFPERAYSPASWAKNYLESMGIEKPEMKFKIPKKYLAIAMESYSGGRAETMLRHNEVPVVPVDYTSEYPSVCALLGLFQILTAAKLKFKPITRELRRQLKKIAFTDCFKPKRWEEFVGFALVHLDGDVILPTRSNFNGITNNIANAFLKHNKPIWQPIPDIVASVIRTGKIPRILKAVRIIPIGKQKGMRAINLRGMVKIDPYKDDLLQSVIQQRKLHKKDKGLYYWLKIFANSIYGFFVETNLEYTPVNKPVRVRVHTGEGSYVPKRSYYIEELHGSWYAPYIASLITSGGRLLLAMLEKCVTDAGGVWAWADTDALAIVAHEHGGIVTIKSSERGKVVNRTIKALSWKQVLDITERFEESLNPYDRKLVPNLRLLNLTDDNYVDPEAKIKQQRQLLGMSISAKRYAIYERQGDTIKILNPKAHGLGYLYPPADSPKEWYEDDEDRAPEWIYDLWLWIVQKILGLKTTEPKWFDRAQMQRVCVSTWNVLEACHNWEGFRPFNFFMRPILSAVGRNYEPDKFSLALPMESDQTKWMRLRGINICDPEDRGKYKITTDAMEMVHSLAASVLVDTYRRKANDYIKHPEYKALAPDGSPCKGDTRGLLRRALVVVDKVHRISKECDSRWEEGEDADAIEFDPPNYDDDESKDFEQYSVARERLIRKIKKIGFSQLIRVGCSRYILRKICRREPVRNFALQDYERIVNAYRKKKVNG